MAKSEPYIWVAGFGLVAIAGALAAGSKGGRRLHPPSEIARFNQLQPVMRRQLVILEDRCYARGVSLYWGSALRDEAAQQATIDKGASAVKTVSWHRSGLAIDAYPIDPKTGQPDKAGKNEGLFRIMHQEWARLGGKGLAFKPYPTGPRHYLTGSKGKVWDGGHLEWHGPYATPVAALNAYTAGSRLA